MTDPEWSENDYEEYLMKLAASRRPSIFWKERLLIIPEENEDLPELNRPNRSPLTSVSCSLWGVFRFFPVFS